MLKKSDVLREGYVKGLKDAQRIINEMANKNATMVSDEFRVGELFDFGDFQIDKLITIQEVCSDVLKLSNQMMKIWKGINIKKQTEGEVREKMNDIMEGYFQIGGRLSYLKYKYVDSGLCEEVAKWGKENGASDWKVKDVLDCIKGKSM